MRGSRKRRCENCWLEWKLDYTPDEWLKHKLYGYSIDRGLWEEDPFTEEVDPSNAYTLNDAQLRSAQGRGVLLLRKFKGDALIVYWHRQGYLPEHFDGTRACEGGSCMHDLLRSVVDAPIWTPDEPLNEMEVIARAYGTDDDMFATMMEI